MITGARRSSSRPSLGRRSPRSHLEAWIDAMISDYKIKINRAEWFR
jgi:hypothetical protein